MAKVQGIQEKLHWPLYDAFVVPEQNGGAVAPTFATEMAKRDARILRFFVDVQNKTRLETNLQASGHAAEPQSLRGPRDARGRVAAAAPREAGKTKDERCTIPTPTTCSPISSTTRSPACSSAKRR